MKRLKKCIILETPLVDAGKLRAFVNRCLADGVLFVAVRGTAACSVEDEIDWIVINDGSSPEKLIVTAAFVDESLTEVVDIVSHWDGGNGEYEIIDL